MKQRTPHPALISLFSFCLCFAPTLSFAQSAAPEMFGVNEVVIEYAHFDDVTAADSCNVTRDQVASVLVKALSGSTVPMVPVIDARPVAIGVARIQLVPEIASHLDDNLGCVSFISLTAKSTAKVVVSPISTLRDETILYWQDHIMIASGQSIHGERVGDALQKLALKFAQQYRLDQPPEISR